MSSTNDFYENRYAPASVARPHDLEPTFQARLTRALARLHGRPRRVLDFGCNWGLATEAFVRHGHTATGADISESALAVARERVPGAEFVRVASEDRLPFADGAFEACYASEVIEHLFNVSGFIREMGRVLVPGGLLLLTTPYHGWLKNVIVVTTNFDNHFAPTGGHIRFFSRRSLSSALVEGGFRVAEISGIGRVRYLWKSMFVVAVKA